MIIGIPRRSRAGHDRSIVPMINVVFLLLIFFLMTASLVPPPPLDITPPEAEGSRQEPTPDTLFIAADGALAFGGNEGPAALATLAASMRATDAPLVVQADAALPAQVLAEYLPELAALGIVEIRLITVRP